VALVRKPDVSEEHIASIFRVSKLGVFSPRNEDVPHDGQRRELIATAPPQSCLSVIVVCVCVYVLVSPISLPFERHNILKLENQKDIYRWKLEIQRNIKNVTTRNLQLDLLFVGRNGWKSQRDACGIFRISQTYGPPWPVMGPASHF
jgi:hypothetical protein